MNPTALPGARCPNCRGTGNLAYAWESPRRCACLTGFIVISRKLTRDQWKQRLADMHEARKTASLLRYTDDAERTDRDYRDALRDAWVPVDEVERARNDRWFRLRAALLSARGACAQLRAARSLARAA